MANRWGNNGNSDRLYFWGAPKSLQMVTAAKKRFAPWKKSYNKSRQRIKKQRHHFTDKGDIVKAMFFPVVMYGCESWTIKKVQDLPKNWCFWTLELEKTLESPLDSKEIKPVNLKENQPWIFIGRNDAEAEAPVLWPPDAKSLLIGKNPDAGKDWGQEKGWQRMRLFWIASLTQWMWVWVDSRSWWRTEKSGVL